MTRQKPTLSFWQIWNMCFGFLGIQFGFALQNANVSRIFQTLGAEIDDLPILWVAAPVTGLIVQPIIGYLSDRTWNRLGRRRPYFLGGAILASLALIVMPNSPYLWVAAGMLWIMDASINISMEPFRAFVGDNLPKHQRTLGFAMQSFFIGIGAIVASALPWMMANWFEVSNTAGPGQIPDTVKWSFYLGGVVFLAAVSWTVFSSREYSPEEIAEFEAGEEEAEAFEASLVVQAEHGLHAAALAAPIAILFDGPENHVDVAWVLAEEHALELERVPGVARVAHLADAVHLLIGVEADDRVVIVRGDHRGP
mgnify:CR=1 FL=1